jgi:hypothetical protein
MVVEAWASGWQTRFRSIVQRMGYEDVYDFVMSRRRQSFGEMFGAIRKFAPAADNDFLAFAHLKAMFYVDAEQREQLRTAFMEALVRSFCQFMRSGWNRGKKIRQRRIDVRAEWPTPYLLAQLDWAHKDWIALKARVLSEIENISPPDDWCPESSEDPVIQEAFRRVWPEA